MTFLLHDRAQHRASAGEPIWQQMGEGDDEKAAIQASADLADAMGQSFRRFERRHGLLPGEGRILLMDTGVRRG